MSHRIVTRTLRAFLLQMVVAVAVLGHGVAQAPARIQSIVSAGQLDSMRWPNFRDYQSSLNNFYGPVNYAPAWLGGNKPSAQAMAMIAQFKDAWKKGLEPDDYDASRWDGRVGALQGASGDAGAFDVALTVCTMRYISDLRIGRINPQHLKFNLNVQQKKYDLADFVRNQILPSSDIPAVVTGVEPTFATYRRTEEALERYVKLAGEEHFEKLPLPTKGIDQGQPYAGAAALARKLRLVGDLPANAAAPADPQVYDAALAEGVKSFQRRHGLGDDGKLGAATVAQLNVPLSDRVREIKLTLERWRWLPTEFAEPPIIVNIPDFRLRALDENNKVALEMKVMVGKAMRSQTPVFTRDMTFLVLRPYWNVPPGLMRSSVIPAIKKNRNEVVKKNYEITTRDGTLVTAGPPSDEVMAQLQSGKLTVRQKPGPTNALGLIKLMFPNEYYVYLHSTPSTELFSRSRRDFSAGCVRVEKPAELGAWALRFNQGWSVERVQQAMQSGKDNSTVSLAKKIPVFIVYGTAVAYENNEVHFYGDIYGHDAKLAQALAKGYPYP